MSKHLLRLCLGFLLLGTPLATQAQTQPDSSNQNDAGHFITEYTETVMLGVIGGGLLMNILVGGRGASLVGALIGSSLGGWLFVHLQAGHYVIQRAAPHPLH